MPTSLPTAHRSPPDRPPYFCHGELVADDLHFGLNWEIGLRKWRQRFPEKEMIVLFHPLTPDHKFLGDLPPEQRPAFEPGEKFLLRVNRITVAAHYEALVDIDRGKEITDY